MGDLLDYLRDSRYFLRPNRQGRPFAPFAYYLTGYRRLDPKRRQALRFFTRYQSVPWPQLAQMLALYWTEFRGLEEVRAALRPAGARMLDIGCGRTSVLHLFGEAAYRCGIDPVMAGLAAMYATDPAIEWCAGSAEQLPAANASCDIACCTNVLDHVAEPDRALGEIERVLRPGGRLLLTVDVFRQAHERNAAHPHAFTEERLAQLLRAWPVRLRRDAPCRAQFINFFEGRLEQDATVRERILVLGSPAPPDTPA